MPSIPDMNDFSNGNLIHYLQDSLFGLQQALGAIQNKSIHISFSQYANLLKTSISFQTSFPMIIFHLFLSPPSSTSSCNSLTSVLRVISDIRTLYMSWKQRPAISFLVCFIILALVGWWSHSAVEAQEVSSLWKCTQVYFLERTVTKYMLWIQVPLMRGRKLHPKLSRVYTSSQGQMSGSLSPAHRKKEGTWCCSCSGCRDKIPEEQLKEERVHLGSQFKVNSPSRQDGHSTKRLRGVVTLQPQSGSRE